MIWTFERAKKCVTPTGRTDCHGRRVKILVRTVPPRWTAGVSGVALCVYCGLPPDDRVDPLVIQAERWIEARSYAQSVFRTDSDALVFEETNAVPDVVLRWEGHDAGQRPDKRQVVELAPWMPDAKPLTGPERTMLTYALHVEETASGHLTSSRDRRVATARSLEGRGLVRKLGPGAAPAWELTPWGREMARRLGSLAAVATQEAAE